MFSLKVHALEHPSKEALDAMLSPDVTAGDGSSKEPAIAGSGSKDGRISEGGGDEAKATDNGMTRTINFSSGNPRVEATRGVMHLYRDTDSEPGSSEKLPVGRSERLCVLAVPNHMTGSGFCQFTGAFMENIKEMRFVRNDGQTDRYSVLMTFDSQQFADDFYQHYNLKPFSSLEAELCHVLFTADVLFTETAEQASIPPSGLTELPTCPVCLERLDQQVSGILTTVCNHSFHSACISKWTDSSCPVCRYCQQQSENSTCFVCGTSENLWICVICGFVGCGRSKEGHDVNHWKESKHRYSLDLETQRVWDYVGDGYVHRLIQSKTDGKLVELPAPCQDGSDDCCNCGTDNQGMESALYHRNLDSVQASREQKYQHRQSRRAARSLSRGKSAWDMSKRGSKEGRITKDDLKKAVEAATQAANSAAEAAQNASSLVTKNSEALGNLLQSLNASTSKRSPRKKERKTSSDSPEDSESSSDSEESSDSDEMKDLAKKIVTQNLYTHVVLGFMLVSSFVWRYIVVKVAKRVKNKVTDPWGYVGGMFNDNFKGAEKEKKDKEKDKEKGDSDEDNSNGLSMPQITLPAFLNGERKEEREAPTPTTDVKEDRVLTVGDILPSKADNSS